MIKSIRLLSITSLIVLFFNFFNFFLIGKFYKLEEFFEFSVLTSFAFIFVKIFSFGWREKIIIDSSSMNKKNNIIFLNLIISFMAVIFFSITLFIYIFFSDNNFEFLNIIIIDLTIIFLILNPILNSFLEKNENFKKISNMRIMRSLVMITIFSLFLYLDQKKYALFLSLIFSELFIFLLLIKYLDFSFKNITFNFSNQIKHVKLYFLRSNLNKTVYIQQLISSITDNFIIIFFGFFGVFNISSGYSFFQKMNGIINSIISYPIKTVSFPNISKKYSLKDIKTIFEGIVFWQIIVLFPIILIFIFYLKLFIDFIGFQECIISVQILSILYIGRLVSLFLGPFPEIFYNLNIGGFYNKLLVFRFVSLCIFSIVYLISEINNILFLFLPILLINLTINLILIFNVYRILNVNIYSIIKKRLNLFIYIIMLSILIIQFRLLI